MHDCVSITCDDEHDPPHASGMMERLRVCVPPPHGAEHAPHAIHALIWQFCGQHCVLHCCVCIVCVSLHDPPHVAGVIERVRDCVPPPQPAEHTPQPDHWS